MIALDTNVLISAIQAGDTPQGARARALIGTSDCFIAKSVLLETEWVLRSALKMPRAQIASVLRTILETERFSVENVAQVAEAVEWTLSGMDFADALHLSASVGCDAFATFDRRFIGRAAGLSIATPVQEP